MKLLNKHQILLLAITGMLCFILTGASKQSFTLSRFISPDTCSGCHGDIYDQWNNSMHHLSQKDPIYLALSQYLLKGLSHKDELKEAESCVKCHVPVGFVCGYPQKTSDDIKKIANLPNQGIQCDYCHSVTGVHTLYNNGLILTPGNGEDEPGVKTGPFKDSEPEFHAAKYSQLHTRSEICGTCHDVKHVVFGTQLETTYSEWKKSPYNTKDPSKRVTCQGCHMHQRPGVPATGATKRPQNPGTAADGGPDRPHIFTHYFVGANSYIPGKFNDNTKTKMAIERLTHCALVVIDDKDISKNTLHIHITNTGAGHKLPTGLTDIRQMWLSISITDKKGSPIYTSGIPDKSGYLPKDTIMYNTIFGDSSGKPVVNISKARQILKDKRIAPLQTVTEHIRLPTSKWRHLTIHVKLCYRSAPQEILDTVLGKGKQHLPVITMAKVKKTVTK